MFQLIKQRRKEVKLKFIEIFYSLFRNTVFEKCPL